MQLYFLPMSCSMASRIALTEAEVPTEFVEVDALNKSISVDGKRQDYREVNPLGLVPALRLDDGRVLTENNAVLEQIADLGGGTLAPVGRRAELRQWLGFIATELHAGIFSVLLGGTASDGARAVALKRAPSRLQRLEQHLSGRDYLLGEFTVADAYLIVVLNWAQVTKVSLDPFPQVRSYLARGLGRASVKQALAIELPLYLEELRREREAAQAMDTSA